MISDGCNVFPSHIAGDQRILKACEMRLSKAKAFLQAFDPIQK
jgi:hypothetical protein